MKTFKIIVMHPGGTTYDYIIDAVRYYCDHNTIIFIDENERVKIYPQALTIIIEL